LGASDEPRRRCGSQLNAGTLGGTRIILRHRASASLIGVVLAGCATHATKPLPASGDDGKLVALCAIYYCETGRWPAAFADLERFSSAHLKRISEARLQISDWQRYHDARIATSNDGKLLLRFERLGNLRRGASELAVPPPLCSNGKATLHDIRFRAPPEVLP